MHLALIKYSVLRLALFVGSLMLLWAVGVRQSILMLALAALISLALSYLFLGAQREAVAQGLAARIDTRLRRREGLGQADADDEDQAIDRSAAKPDSTSTASPDLTDSQG